MSPFTSCFRRFCILLFSVALAGVIASPSNSQASPVRTSDNSFGLINDRGVGVALETSVNDSILWHLPLKNIEDVYYNGTLLHDEGGNSLILADGNLISVNTDGQKHWSTVIVKHGTAPRSLVQGGDGTIYVLQVEEYLNDAYTSNTGWITAVDPRTGAIRWQTGMPDSQRLSQEFVAAGDLNGVLVVASSTGSHLAYDKYGKLIWTQPVKETRSLAADPTGGFVAVGYEDSSFGKSPYVLHWSEDGKSDWKINTADIPVNSMSVRVTQDGGIYATGFCSVVKWNGDHHAFERLDVPTNALLRQIGLPFDPKGGYYCYDGGGTFKMKGAGERLWHYQAEPGYDYSAYLQSDWAGNVSFTDSGSSWIRLSPDGQVLSRLRVSNARITNTPQWSLANGTTIMASNTVGMLAIGNADRPIRLFDNGVPLQSDMDPLLVDSQTFVPLRSIAAALGADVQWNGDERSVTISGRQRILKLWIGQRTAVVNGSAFSLETAPFIQNERTLVPLRFLADSLGYETDWDALNRFVTVR